MKRSQKEEEKERDERLEYCKGIVELLCFENPSSFAELVRAGLRGVERARKAKEAQSLDTESRS